MYQKFWKRLIDIVLSGCGILVLLPVYLVIAVAVKLDDPGPVFFRQKRVGIHKSHFHILKFRTMKMETPIPAPQDGTIASINTQQGATVASGDVLVTMN